MSDVFVSYSRKDADFGKRLHAALTQAGRDVWMDWEDIPLTVDFWQEIKSGIESADNFVLIISPDSIGSPICQLEVEHAIALNKRIIPIVHRDPDKDSALSHAIHRAQADDYIQKLLDKRDVSEIINANWLILASLNWIFFQADDDFDTRFTDLSRAIDFDHQHVQLHTRLLLRVLEWQDDDKHPSRLLRGAEIDEAERWQAAGQEKDPPPGTDHADFILASRQYQRQQSGRLLTAAAFAVVVSLSLAILSGFQTIQANNNFATAEYNQQVAATNEVMALEAAATAERQAVEAESIALISNAQLILPDNPPLALALAQEAIVLPNPPVMVERGYAEIAYHPNIMSQKIFEGSGDVRAMQYSDDGNMIIALIAYYDDVDGWIPGVFAWDALTLEPIDLTESEAASYLESLEALTFGDDYTERYREIYQLIGGTVNYSWESGVAMFSPDDRYLAIGTALDFVPDEEIAIIDTYWPDMPDVNQQIWPVATSAIAFTPDSSQVAFGFFDGSIALFNTNSTKTLFSFGTGEARQIQGMAFHPNGRHLAVIFNATTYGRVNDLKTAVEVWDLSYGAEIYHTGVLVNSPAPITHPDNEHIYVPRALIDQTNDANFDMLNIATGDLTPYLDEHHNFYWYVLRDANWESTFRRNDNVIERRDIETDEVIQIYEGHNTNVRMLRLAPDSKSLLSFACIDLPDTDRCRGEIIIWDIETGDIKYQFDEINDFSSDTLTITPDNTTLVYTIYDRDAEQQFTKFTDVESGEITQTLPVGNEIVYFLSDTEMMFSPSLQSQGNNATFSLWNYATGEFIRTYEGSFGIATSNGQVITAKDNRVIIWEGNEQARILQVLDEVNGLSVSNDGQTLIVSTRIGHSDMGSSFNDAFIFRLDTLEEMQTWVSENRMAYELTCAERIAYRVTPYCEPD